MTASPSFQYFPIPDELRGVLAACPSWRVVRSAEELQAMACAEDPGQMTEVAYDVPGLGRVVEADVCRVRNGIAANYREPRMRRRDPNCMVIGDEGVTHKPRYRDRFGHEFAGVREATFEWLKTQDLVVFPFVAGMPTHGAAALAVCPANAAFFALGLALLQGILDVEQLVPDFNPQAIVYVAPPFRHTHFDGQQVVVHNRLPGMHELFSYNLYPGPSAKKGVYGMLLAIGEKEHWLTAHCSTVRCISPYGNRVAIMHEGASGGGKSEMLEQVHRERDGRLLLGSNTVTGDKRYMVLPHGCELQPVTDDMALCHPSLQKDNGLLTVIDAEDAWFVRVNHITRYGVDPHLEEATIHPPEPLLFLNIEAVPGGTALIWDHIHDAPGKPCPNPRVIVPRKNVPGVHHGPITVDVRSFGVRCPPCTREQPTFGIVGLFHVLPPALAWLWRLVAPRGYANPSITDSEAMSSEGVGSYWPFATGREVDQANLLLDQVRRTHRTRYLLIPNQHLGAWKVSFMPQWITREYITRRGHARFDADQLTEARCPLLGYALTDVVIEGQSISQEFLEVDRQPEVGREAYDAGAAQLEQFFRDTLEPFITQTPDLDPLGRRIVEAALHGARVADYEGLLAGADAHSAN